MTVQAGSIVQTNSGSTQGTPASTFVVSFNSPVPAGSAMLLWIATLPSTSMSQPGEFDWFGWQYHSVSSASTTIPAMWQAVGVADSTLQSWTFNSPGDIGAAPYVWAVAEIKDLLGPPSPPLMNQSDTGTETVQVDANATSGSTSTLAVGPSPGAGVHEDTILFASLALTSSSGDVPNVTDIASNDGGSGAGGSWEIFEADETTNSGARVGLAVAHRVPGTLGPFGATWTTASNPAAMYGKQTGYLGDRQLLAPPNVLTAQG